MSNVRTGFRAFTPIDIEVLRDDLENLCSKEGKRVGKSQNIKIHVSINTKDYANAFVVGIVK